MGAVVLGWLKLGYHPSWLVLLFKGNVMNQELIEELAKKSGLWQIFEEMNVDFPWPEVEQFAKEIYFIGGWDSWNEEQL